MVFEKGKGEKKKLMKRKMIISIFGILLNLLFTIILLDIEKIFPDWSFTLGQFSIMFATIIASLIVKYGWEHFYE